MSNKIKILIGVGLVALLLMALIASTAFAQGRNPWRFNDNWGPSMMHGNWNTPRWSPSTDMPCGADSSPGSPLWGPSMMGYGRMHHGWGLGWLPGMTDPSQCPFWEETTPAGEVLTLDDAQLIAEQYLASYGNDDLEIAEIMQFSQNFYVEVHEVTSGIGAMELLIDPNTGAVHPEPGPNMMWNTKYGHMGGRGMMGGWFQQSSGAMTVSEDEAIAAAQSWLDTNKPGVNAGDEAEPFYGYYTIHTLDNGDISGMLSVNGYTGQVWYHNWHGDFIDMTAGHSE